MTNTAFEAPAHDYSASYEEVQSFSPRFRAYMGWLSSALTERHGLPGTSVLEIGCGRGDFLLELCEVAGCEGLGVDPSFKELRLEGPAAARVSIRRSFFSEADVDRELSLVICRHTLEHVHDVHDFLVRLRASLDATPRTAVFFEVPDMGRILRETAFWDVFYEHVTYFTPGSAARAFRAAGFKVERLELGFEDEYILLTATPANEGGGGKLLDLEESVGTVATQAARYVRDLDASRLSWAAKFRGWRAKEETTVIWGAGSKGVGFLSTLELSDEVACAVDINPAKHGTFMAGTGHEVVGPESLRDIRPSLVIVMNPVYADEVRVFLNQLGVAATVETV